MVRWKHVLLLVVGVSLLLGLGCAPAEEETSMEEETPMTEPTDEMTEAPPLTATATLTPRSDNEVSGSVTFTQEGDTVTIVAEVQGATPGLHGFHIHDQGDCSAADFTSTGGHFNPASVDHAGPADAVRHAGDLGNIEIGEDGSGTLEVTSDLITVAEGPNSVVGRGVILHEGEDDLTTQPTGAAGGRIACGVVEASGM